MTTVDEAAFAAYLAGLDEQYGATARDGAVTFDGGDIVTTKAREGKALDPDTTRAALEAAFLDEDAASRSPWRTPPWCRTSTPADVAGGAQLLRLTRRAAPVTLSFGGIEHQGVPRRLHPRAVASCPPTASWCPTLDAATLAEIVAANVVTERRPGRRDRRAGQRRAAGRPGQAGRDLRPRPARRRLPRRVAKPQGERTLQLEAKVAKPDFTTKDARALQIDERVSTFTTYFPYAEYRNVNIGRAAELVNGTVLKPGETFSLNDTVGERTEANGFTQGYVINDGILIQDLGGGVSQMATTTFNAMFFAGLEDVEHKPHSFYIDRYPIGREATVAWGAIDLRFTNDTPYGVLIQASVTPSTVSSSGVATVSMYSTKHWDITTTTGEQHNVTEPEVRRIDDRVCHPNEGYDGFDVDVIRYFTPVGANAESREPETFSTTYTPSDTVICTNPNYVDE